MGELVIYWHRHDLRIRHNHALNEAARLGDVLPLFIYNPNEYGEAQRVWLHYSLQKLSAQYNNRLIIREGNPKEILAEIVDNVNAKYIFWNRRYDIDGINIDKEIKEYFKDKIILKSFRSNLLCEPWHIKNNQDSYFKVFTPFYKKLLSYLEENFVALPEDVEVNLSKKNVTSLELSQLELLPKKPDWGSKFLQYFEMGEHAAYAKFNNFISNKINDYAEGRNFLNKDVCSALSPHLHFGEISVDYIFQALQFKLPDKQVYKFISELCWREFSYYLLYNYPTLRYENFNKKFDKFSWQNNDDLLQKWCQGKTGYPIIDAAMKELYETGYMHNRARMIVASFLIKDLLIDWRLGEKFFWEQLLDADLANNSASWQWVAGSGADAAPYFRIFNPITQGEKFDEDGSYIRKWLPILAKLSNTFIHKPWQASQSELDASGVKLGDNYPWPIVNHADARNRALDIFKLLGKGD
jgi:deoxyribodipyrimidine photo-lyase